MTARSRLIRTALALGVVLLIVGQAAALGKSSPEIGASEVKMGEEAAAEVVKENKLSDKADDLKRLREIGDKLATVANTKEVPSMYGISRITPFRYTFDIIEAPDVNAFCVPGGRIYVYRGLLDFVQSDQELAAVIAHEVVHAAHHHMAYLMASKGGLDNLINIALLAAMIGAPKSGEAMYNIAMGIKLYHVARTNSYGMQAERDADNGAVLVMKEAGYNPVGLLTFLERMARRPEIVDYGILRTHPVDSERVTSAKSAIKALGLPINRRETTRAAKAEVKTETVGGAEVPAVSLDGKIIYRAAPSIGQSAAQRAQDTVDRINKMLDADLQIRELRVDPGGGGVIARDQALVVVTDADAKLMDKTPAEVSQSVAAAIREVIMKQMFETLH